MTAQLAQQLAVVRRPMGHRVFAGGQDQVAIGAVQRELDTFAVPAQAGDVVAAADIPDAGQTVGARRQQASAIGLKHSPRSAP